MNLPAGKLTNGLIIANVVIFLIIWIFGWEQDAVLRGGMFPIRLSGEALDLSAHGWMVPALLTPLSSAFLHSGFVHIGFNMLMLLFCGRFVEQALGPALMAILYVVGAYAAAFAQYAVDSVSMIPMVGASGAISAILGAYALLFARNRVDAVGPFPGHVVRIVWLTLAWIGIQLMIGLATSGSLQGIAIFAHIGGFIAGLLLTRPLLEWRFRSA
ncbi:MAG: rhomboid family intramembrane serine protease [Sphingomonadales bacterium]|nr:rhomboid family intramembrane serine protease [Sphingomonadales bacterium]PIX65939.1 MAG: rhomboid family intramembrane serine protease [Sphingomonadales bacterium CG_4_10_14_3_um_filter_58_15]NCO47980.1 rhomboid family intramembrane serine protease [Sphingomonadales bacterium]NCP01198.1 rhomboid family intramembrane serine protease [Sphingomonadales bacterium]NCP28198.1 rhomboid family intramembrane serine protease [Sphingomonadales bacterium]